MGSSQCGFATFIRVLNTNITMFNQQPNITINANFVNKLSIMFVSSRYRFGTDRLNNMRSDLPNDGFDHVR